MAKTQIVLKDMIQGQLLRVNLPDDVLLAQLVPALARKLGLPEGEYRLAAMGGTELLPTENTLLQVGVAEGWSYG